MRFIARMKLSVESLLREFSGWQEVALNGDCYQRNMESGILFINDLQNGLTGEFGIKCCIIFSKILIWNILWLIVQFYELMLVPQ